MRVVAILSIGLAGCWTGHAPASVTPTPPSPAPDAREPGYRSETMAVDAIGVATMTAGLVGLERGSNENVDGALMVTGLAIAGFGDPIVHLAHGHGGRAAASYVIRAVTISMGAMMGVAFENCRNELFCGLDGMLWGTAGGLAAAGVVDALVLHGQVSNTWTPTVLPSDGGARVGLARPW